MGGHSHARGRSGLPDSAGTLDMLAWSQQKGTLTPIIVQDQCRVVTILNRISRHQSKEPTAAQLSGHQLAGRNSLIIAKEADRGPSDPAIRPSGSIERQTLDEKTTGQIHAPPAIALAFVSIQCASPLIGRRRARAQDAFTQPRDQDRGAFRPADMDGSPESLARDGEELGQPVGGREPGRRQYRCSAPAESRRRRRRLYAADGDRLELNHEPVLYRALPYDPQRFRARSRDG